MSKGFLLDEHLPRWWPRAIRQRDRELLIWSVGNVGAPHLNAADSILLDWCEANDTFLLTNNRKSMPQHLADHIVRVRHVPGIFVIDPAEILDRFVLDLSLIMGASLPGEYRDQIRYLPVT